MINVDKLFEFFLIIKTFYCIMGILSCNKTIFTFDVYV